MPDFSKRDTTPELMDTEVVSYEELRGVLQRTHPGERAFNGLSPDARLFQAAG